MKRLVVMTGLAAFLLSTNVHAQSGTGVPPADAGHASQSSCVILKRMGRIGRTESRLSHFGISGKQFRYVEGNLPEGFSRHGKMTEHDVRNLQARGAQVLVLDSHYTSHDLQEARADCHGETGKTLDQAEAKAPPAPEATVSDPAPKPPAEKAPPAKAEDSAPSTGAAEAALVDVSSTPPGADVYVDDQLLGHTPSTTLILTPGTHKIAVKKAGFVVWMKTLRLPSGPVNVDAQLRPKRK